MKSARSTDTPRPWSDWQPLSGFPVVGADVLAETLDGGQAFRWHRQPDTTWLGIWSNTIVRIRLGADERGEWSAPSALAKATAVNLATYFATSQDFSALADTLPWRSDPH